MMTEDIKLDLTDIVKASEIDMPNDQSTTASHPVQSFEKPVLKSGSLSAPISPSIPAKPTSSPSSNPFAKSGNSSKRRPSEMLSEIGIRTDTLPEGFFADR